MGDIFTVREALNRPLFRDSVVEAGHLGLDREIRWVHVLEVSNIASLINGGELILSTGVGLQGDRDLQRSYLTQLIESGATALCIELGSYLDHVTDEMKQIAQEASFPLITFRKIVRFVDITEDLHSIILERRKNTRLRRQGIYRLFQEMENREVIHSFIQDYLEPVIRYDTEHKTDLLKTLRVYLKHIDSKQLAAKELYIHRQTFYLRIEKLKELLGNDFMKDEHRLCLEVALRAYDFFANRK